MDKILHKNYKSNPMSYKLKLPIDLDVIIPDNDLVRLLSCFVEDMDLREL